MLVRDIEHRAGQMREVSFEVRLAERWGEGLVSVVAESAIRVDARLESVHEGILATGTADAEYRGVCGRCLVDIAAPVNVEFQELFAYPGGEADDLEVQDDHVDLETPVRDAVILSLSFQPVCRPDCPGLDPETGERLDDSRAETRQSSTDPRWAALAGLASESAAGSDDDEPEPQT